MGRCTLKIVKAKWIKAKSIEIRRGLEMRIRQLEGGVVNKISGGMASMSSVPYYMARGDMPYGGVAMKDGLVADGLTNVYNKFHMGYCGENTAKKLNISREEQDEYGINSYKRAAATYENGDIKDELVALEVKGKHGKPSSWVTEDEEFKKVNFSKFRQLGTVAADVTMGTKRSATDSDDDEKPAVKKEKELEEMMRSNRDLRSS